MFKWSLANLSLILWPYGYVWDTIKLLSGSWGVNIVSIVGEKLFHSASVALRWWRTVLNKLNVHFVTDTLEIPTLNTICQLYLFLYLYLIRLRVSGQFTPILKLWIQGWNVLTLGWLTLVCLLKQQWYKKSLCRLAITQWHQFLSCLRSLVLNFQNCSILCWFASDQNWLGNCILMTSCWGKSCIMWDHRLW